MMMMIEIITKFCDFCHRCQRIRGVKYDVIIFFFIISVFNLQQIRIYKIFPTQG